MPKNTPFKKKESNQIKGLTVIKCSLPAPSLLTVSLCTHHTTDKVLHLRDATNDLNAIRTDTIFGPKRPNRDECVSVDLHPPLATWHSQAVGPPD